jgi:FkbM family methyltransferase
MYYGQNNEDQIIAKWFDRNYGEDFQGTLLSLGENNGLHLSNARHFIREKGFQAVLVEPAPSAFLKLHNLYRNDENVQLFNFAVTNKGEKVTLYESGAHLNNDDTALLSSLNPEEIKRWGVSTEFVPVEVKGITFEELLSRSFVHTFDYITIDVEGEELSILDQINFNILETKCVCIEWNSKNFDQFNACFTAFGFTLLHTNPENLIYVK